MFVIKINLGAETHEFSFKDKNVINHINSFDSETRLKYVKGIKIETNKEKLVLIQSLIESLTTNDLTVLDKGIIKKNFKRLLT